MPAQIVSFTRQIQTGQRRRVTFEGINLPEKCYALPVGTNITHFKSIRKSAKKLVVYLTCAEPQTITFTIHLADESDTKLTATVSGENLEVVVQPNPQPAEQQRRTRRLRWIFAGMVLALIIIYLTTEMVRWLNQPTIKSFSPATLVAGQIATVTIKTSKPLDFIQEHDFALPKDVLFLGVRPTTPGTYLVQLKPVVTCLGSRTIKVIGGRGYFTFKVEAAGTEQVEQAEKPTALGSILIYLLPITGAVMLILVVVLVVWLKRRDKLHRPIPTPPPVTLTESDSAVGCGG